MPSASEKPEASQSKTSLTPSGIDTRRVYRGLSPLSPSTDILSWTDTISLASVLPSSGCDWWLSSHVRTRNTASSSAQVRRKSDCTPSGPFLHCPTPRPILLCILEPNLHAWKKHTFPQLSKILHLGHDLKKGNMSFGLFRARLTLPAGSTVIARDLFEI